MKINERQHSIFLLFVVLGLIAPIFFQLQGKIYLDTGVLGLVDSGGQLSLVPLPISLIACAIGLIIYYRDLVLTKPAIWVIAGMFTLLGISCLVTGSQTSKLILLLQFMLPLFALPLGMVMPRTSRNLMAKIFLYFLICFVPFQLLATWEQGNLALTHILYLFGVYQHFQYVPLIIASLFAWTWVELGDTHAKWIYALAPWMGMYVAAGNSVLALFGLVAFSCAFAMVRWRSKKIFLVPVLIIIAIGGYFYLNSQIATQLPKYGEYHGVFVGKFFEKNGQPIHLLQRHSDSKSLDSSRGSETRGSEEIQLPINVSTRLPMASRYWEGITESTTALMFGHESPPPRKEITSAHNYYLDLTYNFGVLACLPLFGLVMYTIFVYFKAKKKDPAALWFLSIIFFIVLIDSNLKVTLRQPYPGLITFFLWGVLLTLLGKTQHDENNEKS